MNRSRLAVQFSVALTTLALLSACVPAPSPMLPTGEQATTRPALTEQLSPTAGPTGKGSAPAPTSANPGFLAAEILGRPTATSMTANAVPAIPLEIYYEYGTAPGVYTAQTVPQSAAAGMPLETTIGGLEPNTRYYYRLRYGDAAGPEGTFVTQRAPGSTFTFDLQGDSHPERVKKQFDPDLYTRTLLNAAADRPDFYITLGDDFSVDALKAISAESVTQLYVNQRQYLGLVEAPLFLVNGNHEQAALANLDGTPDNVAVWAQTARNAYYPQPAPDGFYSGDAEPAEFVGLLRDYYAWAWGDALFVVIDPYWHSPVPVDNPVGGGAKTRDLWQITLGDAQYQWFKQTLEESPATYKFVFAHHVNGTGRGGVEVASGYEWGDAAGLAAHRPGWDRTIHQLMVDNGVTIFFQGHDHIFAHQELDGVVYQTLPDPANPNYTMANADSYESGVKLPGSGHVRVTVAPQGVAVAYVRAFLPQDETTDQVNGMVAYSYTIAPASSAPSGAFPGTVILGRPTATSIVANLLSAAAGSVYLAYGPQGEGAVTHSLAVTLAAGAPTTVVLEPLLPDTQYQYQLYFRQSGTATFVPIEAHTFHTQRAPGSAFTFTIDADPHNRDARSDGALYARTLQNALADQPDFHIDLGDTFMTEKLGAASYDGVVQTMLDMRPFFGLIGQSVPLYLVNGNHEGELGWLLNGSADNVAVWSTQARQLYYPNPTSSDFYGGSAAPEPFIGLRDGYYAWKWGDALFVALDPFWYTAAKPGPGGDNWGWTLGRAQYDWLRQTLEESESNFKFVFIHHLVGGSNDDLGLARGGVEWAGLYEWGGYNQDGSWGFDIERPGWGAPVHQLLVDNHVTIVFHGHDHLFAAQTLDGVVYQEVPQPSHRGDGIPASAAEYGYVEGTILGGSGHLRVSVSPTAVTVDYVQAYLPEDETAGWINGTVGYSYTVSR